MSTNDSAKCKFMEYYTKDSDKNNYLNTPPTIENFDAQNSAAPAGTTSNSASDPCRAEYIEIKQYLKDTYPALNDYDYLLFHKGIEGYPTPKDFFHDYYAGANKVGLDLIPQKTAENFHIVPCKERIKICGSLANSENSNSCSDNTAKAGQRTPDCKFWMHECDIYAVFTKKIHFELSENPESDKIPLCSHCGSNENVYLKQRNSTYLVHDLQCLNFPTTVLCNRRRFKCKIHDKGNLYVGEPIPRHPKSISLSMRLAEKLRSTHTDKYIKKPLLAEGYGLSPNTLKDFLSASAKDEKTHKDFVDLHKYRQRNYKMPPGETVCFFTISFNGTPYLALCKTNTSQACHVTDQQIVELYRKEDIELLKAFHLEKSDPLKHDLFFLGSMPDESLSLFLFDYCSTYSANNIAQTYFPLKIAVLLCQTLHDPKYAVGDFSANTFFINSYNWPNDTFDDTTQKYDESSTWSAFLIKLLDASRFGDSLEFLYDEYLEDCKVWLENTNNTTSPVYAVIQELEEYILQQAEARDLSEVHVPLPEQYRMEDFFSLPEKFIGKANWEGIEQELQFLQYHMESLFPEYTNEEFVQDVLHLNRAADPYVFKKCGDIFVRHKGPKKSFEGRGTSLRCLNCFFEKLKSAQNKEDHYDRRPSYTEYDVDELHEHQLLNRECPMHLQVCRFIKII